MNSKPLSIKEARIAKEQVVKLLKRLRCPAAVGLTKHQGEMAVKVNFESTQRSQPLPETILGVAVLSEVVGNIRSQPKAARGSPAAHALK
ncbi:MAG: hypothetical protein ACKVY0_15105 [Prosthecobacter sp.]|uniref:hypothetical protein n=1 Tax=Prosthecobacter sp. TaxID=1965333 RepID=UPI0039039E19